MGLPPPLLLVSIDFVLSSSHAWMLLTDISSMHTYTVRDLFLFAAGRTGKTVWQCCVDLLCVHIVFVVDKLWPTMPCCCQYFLLYPPYTLSLSAVVCVSNPLVYSAQVSGGDSDFLLSDSVCWLSHTVNQYSTLGMNAPVYYLWH